MPSGIKIEVHLINESRAHVVPRSGKDKVPFNISPEAMLPRLNDPAPNKKTHEEVLKMVFGSRFVRGVTEYNSKDRLYLITWLVRGKCEERTDVFAGEKLDDQKPKLVAKLRCKDHAVRTFALRHDERGRVHIIKAKKVTCPNCEKSRKLVFTKCIHGKYGEIFFCCNCGHHFCARKKFPKFNWYDKFTWLPNAKTSKTEQQRMSGKKQEGEFVD